LKVGYLNFRYFLLFLISNIVISLYGCYLSIYLMRAKGDSIGLNSGYAFNRYTRRYEKIGFKEYILVNKMNLNILTLKKNVQWLFFKKKKF